MRGSLDRENHISFNLRWDARLAPMLDGEWNDPAEVGDLDRFGREDTL